MEPTAEETAKHSYLVAIKRKRKSGSRIKKGSGKNKLTQPQQQLRHYWIPKLPFEEEAEPENDNEEAIEKAESSDLNGQVRQAIILDKSEIDQSRMDVGTCDQTNQPIIIKLKDVGAPEKFSAPKIEVSKNQGLVDLGGKSCRKNKDACQWRLGETVEKFQGAAAMRSKTRNRGRLNSHLFGEPELTQEEIQYCAPVLELMPDEFGHEMQRNKEGMLDLEYLPNGNFHATIRANLQKEEEIKGWLKSFANKTRTCWILGRIYPVYAGRIMLCRKDFKCQHASKNKSEKIKTKRARSRDFNCQAHLSIRIKSRSAWCVNRADYYDYLKRGLCGIIKINFDHSHSLDSADMLGYLRPNPEIKDTFFQYFREGLSGVAAISKHKERLGLEATDETSLDEILADASVNPRAATVYNWRKEFKELNYGEKKNLTGSEIFKTLKTHLPRWQERGFAVKLSFEQVEAADTVTLNDNTVRHTVTVKDVLSVAVITPVMKRTLECLPAENQRNVFVESCEVPNTAEMTLAVVMAPAPVGAVPIGVVFSWGFHQIGFKRGFNHLKALFEENLEERGPFGNPKHVITGEHPDIRKAILEIWPQSEVHLSAAHAAHGAWAWLIDNRQNIDRSDLLEMIRQFTSIQKTQTQEQCEMAYAEIVNSHEGDKYPNWLQFLDNFVIEKNEREDSLNRLPQVDSYTEATVGLFRNVLLSGYKACYNAVSLIDYLMDELDKYFLDRYTKFVEGEALCLSFDWNALKRKAVAQCDVWGAEEDLFVVWSKGEPCLVNTSTGTCSSCVYWTGTSSIYCAHLAAVAMKFPDISLPCATNYSLDAVKLMGRIVYGSDEIAIVQNDDEGISYGTVTVTTEPLPLGEYGSTYEAPSTSRGRKRRLRENRAWRDMASTSTNVTAEDGLHKEVSNFWQDFEEKVREFGSPGSVAGVRKMAKRVKGIRTQAEFQNFLQGFNARDSSVKTEVKKKKKIGKMSSLTDQRVKPIRKQKCSTVDNAAINVMQIMDNQQQIWARNSEDVLFDEADLNVDSKEIVTGIFLGREQGTGVDFTSGHRKQE